MLECQRPTLFRADPRDMGGSRSLRAVASGRGEESFRPERAVDQHRGWAVGFSYCQGLLGSTLILSP